MIQNKQIRFGLSARLLILTAVFILLAEAFIYVPSIARYRSVYFEEHMESAHLAALSLEAAPDQMVNHTLRQRLLSHAESYGIILTTENKRMLALSKDMPPAIDETIDTRNQGWWQMITGAFNTLSQTENRILRVIGPSPQAPETLIEVILDEKPLRDELVDYSRRILNLSLAISFFAAILIYISLNWLLVRPIRRFANNMAAFRESPEDESRKIQPSARRDEIGMMENELFTMQSDLRKLLRQKDRLAAIGTAVAKINHDLRNSLSRAMLVSDQLATSHDSKVRQLAPQLSQSVDQAIELCSQTMNYVVNSAPRIDKELFYLSDLIDDIFDHVKDLCVDDDNCNLINEIPTMSEIEGDVAQLRRVMINLTSNALQMGASQVTYRYASLENGHCTIDIEDNGPGLPPKARDNLFKPFEGSSRSGGTGLGLVIARDIMRHHNGDLTLVSTGPTGTCFRLSLPHPRMN